MTGDTEQLPEPTAESTAVAPTTPETAKPDETKAEAPPEAKAKEDQVKERDAARFAALARQERAIRAREHRIKQESERVKTELDQLKAFRADLEGVKADPIGFLQKHGGITLDEAIRQKYLKDEEAPPPKASPEVEELRKQLAELTEWRKSREETEKQTTAEQKKHAIEAAVRSHVEAQFAQCAKEPDAFELILANKDEAGQLYLQYGDKVCEELGRMLTPEESRAILEEVEKTLTQRVEARLLAAAKTKRFSSRFVTVEKPEQRKSSEPQDAKSSPTKPVTRTITNEMGRPIPGGTPKRGTPKSRDEVHEEQMALIRAKYPSSTPQ